MNGFGGSSIPNPPSVGYIFIGQNSTNVVFGTTSPVGRTPLSLGNVTTTFFVFPTFVRLRRLLLIVDDASPDVGVTGGISVIIAESNQSPFVDTGNFIPVIIPPGSSPVSVTGRVEMDIILRPGNVLGIFQTIIVTNPSGSSQSVTQHIYGGLETEILALTQ